MKARGRWVNSSNESCNTHKYHLNEKSTLGKLLAEKYAFRHSQRLNDIVKVSQWGGQDFHDIAKVCLETQPETT